MRPTDGYTRSTSAPTRAKWVVTDDDIDAIDDRIDTEIDLKLEATHEVEDAPTSISDHVFERLS